MNIRNPKSKIRCAEAGAAAGRRPDYRVLKWIRILAGLVLFSAAVTGRAQESLTNRPFHAGFSAEMLKQFNKNMNSGLDLSYRLSKVISIEGGVSKSVGEWEVPSNFRFGVRVKF